LGIRDANGFTKCDDVLNQQSRQAAAESVRTGAPLGCAAAKQAGGSDTCQNLELACCLTNDHCQSYGCDENIVYDWYYGCTKIDFGKANIGAKSDAAAGAVCAAGTFGCGRVFSTAGNYKSCQPSLSDIHYWSDEKKCDPNPNPTIGNCASRIIAPILAAPAVYHLHKRGIMSWGNENARQRFLKRRTPVCVRRQNALPAAARLNNGMENQRCRNARMLIRNSKNN